MKKRLIVLFAFFCIIVLELCSCNEKGKNPNKAIKYLNNLKTYTCDVNIHIKNSRQEIEMECKQFYNKKYGHRLDIDKNRILLYNGNEIIVNDFNNKKRYSLDKNFDSVFKLSFVKEYINLLNTQENIKNEFISIKDKEYQIVYLDIPGNNRNIKKAKMYIDIENNFPYKIVIYNSKENEVINFVYKNFTPNCEIPKEVFKK